MFGSNKVGSGEEGGGKEEVGGKEEGGTVGRREEGQKGWIEKETRRELDNGSTRQQENVSATE